MYNKRIQERFFEFEGTQKKLVQNNWTNFFEIKEEKDSSNSSKPSSTNVFKNVITNNRNKSTKKRGGHPKHKGTTLTNDKIEEMIKNNKIDEIITIEENKTDKNKNLAP